MNNMTQNIIRSLSDRKKPQVKLAGEDGNVFSILRRTREAMRKVGWSRSEIHKAMDEMTSGDYDNLLATVMDLCIVDQPGDEQNE
jgi:hypothetical protein